jgi:predicted GTPase
MNLTLSEAVDYAVREGQRAADELSHTVDAVTDQLRQSAEALRPWADWKTKERNDVISVGVAQRFAIHVEEKNKEIRTLFERQREALAKFNVALFGRTGAGKSTLIEALSSGDGESVSQGESDWTQTVRPVDWRGCRLVDAPGINGWGRMVARFELEAQARRAVETSDVVLLCFDTQSQQEAEFQKVAEWVQAYGKPAIAVLNCRNSRWRMPPLVKLASARRNLSKAVREHEGNIRAELARLGLPVTPIVAISAKRALVGRGREPFRGPDAETDVVVPLIGMHTGGMIHFRCWSSTRELGWMLISLCLRPQSFRQWCVSTCWGRGSICRS